MIILNIKYKKKHIDKNYSILIQKNTITKGLYDKMELKYNPNNTENNTPRRR